MQIVTGRRGEPHVTSRQMQAVYRSFLGDFALLDIGNHLAATATSNDNVRISDGVVAVQGIYAVIAYNEYDDNYIEPVSVGMKRIDTLILHYTKSNDIEDMRIEVVEGEEAVDNPVAPTIAEGGDAWEGTADIKVPIYDVLVTSFGLTVTPYSRMNTLIPTLDSIAERIPETVVTGVKGDSEVLYRDGDVNITKANIGLGNVDNTADTDKPISTATQTALNLKADLTYVDAKISAAYHAGGSKTVAELTSALLIADNIGKVYNISDSGVTTSDFVEGAGEPINEGDNVGICNVGTEESPVYKFDLLSGFVDLSAYATTSAVNTALAGKVDKVAGKGLSTEDYTTSDKTKLAGISEGATQTIANPADTATETLSKLEVGGVVYDIPQGASGATELSELTDVNLTDVEDGDILQYDDTANKWKNSNALQGSKTATGNPITIEASESNLVECTAEVEAYQDLHGYDHPWAGGAGKNKLPMTLDGMKASNTTGTWSGNTYAINGGTLTVSTDDGGNVTDITVNGTFNAQTEFRLTNPSNLDNSFYGYILNGSPAYPNDNVSLLVTHIDDGMWKGDQYSYNGADTTIDQSFSTIIFSIFVRSGTSVTDKVFKPMLRLSTETDSTFAPYTNISPITGQTEVVIDDVGKNLLPLSLFDNAEYFTTNSDGTVTQLKNDLRNETIMPTFSLKAGNYIFSRKDVDSDAGEMSLYDITNGVVTWFVQGTLDTHVPITLDKDYENIFVKLSVNGSYPKTFEPMIRFATETATTYEPYKGKTYTIQLGDTIYGGELDVLTGKMVVTHGEVDLGTLNWSYADNRFQTLGIIDLIKKPASGRSAEGLICSRYVASTGGEDHTFFKYETGDLYFYDSSYTSASDFKTAMNGVQLVYELATPYTIQLTPQQIRLLKGTNNISCNTGDLSIKYYPDNVLGQLKGDIESEYDARVETLETQMIERPELKRYSKKIESNGDTSLGIFLPTDKKIIPIFARYDEPYMTTYRDYYTRFYNPIVYYDGRNTYIQFLVSDMPNDGQLRTFEMYYYEV